MKTLYVTDLDGTLLRTDDTVSPFTINTVNGLVDKGMLFTYATARSLVSASVVTRGLSARIPVIAYNGAFIYNAETGIPLYSLFFTPEESAFIISLLQSFRLYPFVYSFQEGIERLSWMSGTENEGCFTYLRKRKGDPRLNPVSDEKRLYAGDIFYFTCIGEKEALQPFYERIAASGLFTCTLQQELYETEYWCEVMPKKATKANAINRLKELWECDRIVSFGDSLNDISMFRISDECYAVENAAPALKEHAAGLIPVCDEDGVAKWLLEHVRL